MKIYSYDYCDKFYGCFIHAPVRPLKDSTVSLKQRVIAREQNAQGIKRATIYLSAVDLKQAMIEYPDLFPNANSRGSVLGWRGETNLYWIEKKLSHFESFRVFYRQGEWKDLLTVGNDKSASYELDCVEIAREIFTEAVKIERTGSRKTQNRAYNPDITVTFANGSTLTLECKGRDSVFSTRSARDVHARDEEE